MNPSEKPTNELRVTVALCVVFNISKGILTVAKSVPTFVFDEADELTTWSVTFPCKSIVSLSLVIPASAVTVKFDEGESWNIRRGLMSSDFSVEELMIEPNVNSDFSYPSGLNLLAVTSLRKNVGVPLGVIAF